MRTAWGSPAVSCCCSKNWAAAFWVGSGPRLWAHLIVPCGIKWALCQVLWPVSGTAVHPPQALLGFLSLLEGVLLTPPPSSANSPCAGGPLLGQILALSVTPRGEVEELGQGWQLC